MGTNHKQHIIRFERVCIHTLAAFMLLSCLPLGAQTAELIPPVQKNSHSWESETAETRLRVGPGDLVLVSVFDCPELAQTVRVDDRGDATFNLIGAVHVANLSLDQTRKEISSRLQKGNFVLHPQVSVFIQEYGTQGVSVLGQVEKPGIYPVLGNKSLIDIVAQAGGTTELAGSTVTIKRASDGSVLTIPLTRDANRTFTADVQLMPGDKVIIPRASIVYVVGDVQRPGGFVMNNDGRITALQALALAGGQNRTAALDHVRLIRKTDSTYNESLMSLKKIMKGQTPDINLEADDVLYIPNSTAKSVIFRGVPSILQGASNAAVYRVP